jgi:hypothetical protein
MKYLCLFITFMVLNGCGTLTREPISEQIKDDFNWKELSFEEKDILYSKYAPVRVLGIFSVSTTPEGSVDADSSAVNLDSIIMTGYDSYMY